MPISKTMGKSIIHGKIVEVGGVSPMVKIEHPAGSPISMSTTKEMAKFMGKYLYRQVVIYGSHHPQGPGSASIQVDIYNVQIISEEEGDGYVEVSVDFVGHEGSVYLMSEKPGHIEFDRSMLYHGALYMDLPSDMRDLLLNGSWKYNQNKDGN